jgi:hypothetical protein
VKGSLVTTIEELSLPFSRFHNPLFIYTRLIERRRRWLGPLMGLSFGHNQIETLVVGPIKILRRRCASNLAYGMVEMLIQLVVPLDELADVPTRPKRPSRYI